MPCLNNATFEGTVIPNIDVIAVSLIDIGAIGAVTVKRIMGMHVIVHGGKLFKAVTVFSEFSAPPVISAPSSFWRLEEEIQMMVVIILGNIFCVFEVQV